MGREFPLQLSCIDALGPLVVNVRVCVTMHRHWLRSRGGQAPVSQTKERQDTERTCLVHDLAPQQRLDNILHRAVSRGYAPHQVHQA